MRARGAGACSARVLLASALLTLAAACTRPPEPRTPIDTVVRRLTAVDFGQDHGLPHGPVVKIGDEARAVAVAPLTVEVASLRGLRLDAGVARHAIELPAAVLELPDEAFQIDVQQLPFTDQLPSAVFDFFATETFHTFIDADWKLLRDPAQPGSATLEVRPPPEQQEVQLNVDLRALLPQPVAVDSPELAIPAGASLSLGYGVASSTGARPRSAIRFQAALRCTCKDEQTLLDQTVAPDAAEGWHDAAFSLPAGDACRLRLASTTPDGEPVRTAVWSQPRITAPQKAHDRPQVDNVIVISLDTLRADHLSGFGYPRATSPTIDAQVIAAGTAFRDVITSFPRTDVAHLSLFTSLFPEAQPAPGRLRADTTAALLTESLRDAGLVTAGFTEDAMIAGAFGFWFGFDRFVERSFAERDRGTLTFADGIDFVRSHKDQRFFLFLHTYKTHKPYVSSEQVASFADASDWQRLPFDDRIPERERAQVDAYDRTIREADDLMRSLLAELGKLGLAERTLVVVMSDHGEAFGEHGAVEHGYAGHQEQLHIPLLLRGPGIPAGVEIDTPASIVDVAPTVLELAGAKPLPDAQGISLAPAFAGRDLPRNRPLFFSWLAQGARGVRHGQWKYLRADHGHELFDLASDPQERISRGRKLAPRAVDAALLADYGATSTRLREKFNASSRPSSDGSAIDQRTQESLRALGYVN